MKKIFKNIIFVLFVIPFAFMFSGCFNMDSKGIEIRVNKGYIQWAYEGENEWNNIISIEELKGEDGKDGQGITIEQLYNKVLESGNYPQDYSIYDFISDYLSIDVGNNGLDKTYLGALSSVAVTCEFTTPSLKDFSQGSGVVYKTPEMEEDEYYIITNHHVCYNKNFAGKISNKIHIYLYGTEIDYTEGTDGATYGENAIACTYVGGSMYNDIAVLRVNDATKIKNSNIVPVTIEESVAKVWQSVGAIGNSEGDGISLTKGVVTVDSEMLTMTAVDGYNEVVYRVIRTDAPVNPGNSGGGLFNDQGKLIGIINAKIIDEDVEGMAYALPIKPVIGYVNRVIKSQGNTTRANLNIDLVSKNSRVVEDSEELCIKIVEDVFVNEVKYNSVCFNKLLKNDRIVSVEVGNQIIVAERVFMVLESTWLMEENTVAYFNVIRNGEAKRIPVTISQLCFNEVN